MFDPATAAFIRQAPALPGLDPAALVDELTAAYVEIAAARLAIASDTAAPSDLQVILERMGRLADTYEGLVVLNLHTEQMRSAAFVAGSARQAIAQVLRLGTREGLPTRLDETTAGAEIAAALLFLIAERSSDAYEASRDIRAAGEPNPIRRALILALGRFARGQFANIAQTDLDSERIGSTDDYGRAADLLFREILRGLMVLARVGLGELDSTDVDNARELFERVRLLSLDSSAEEGLRATSTYGGPHHVAALLTRASDAIREGMLVTILPPTGTDSTQWTRWLRSEAGRWPFLWSNHRAAIATGYLDQGKSLVMTTPTGSGKTTLAALKIAATLSSGKTVVYLAPTHALVGQVERDLNERVVELARAESIEDANLNETVQSLPDIAVVTPERCFALLTFAPELFERVGLLVFDEFHLLGVSKPETATLRAVVDRRGIDAMLCLLTFLTVNKDADLLLLSAMVSNGCEISKWLNKVGRQVVTFDDKWKPTRQLRCCVTYSGSDLGQLTQSLWHSPPPTQFAALPYGLFSLSSGWNPKARDKLLMRPFAAHPIPLKKGQGKWLTSNRYEVAATIADRFAQAGLKVVIFCESIPMCISVAGKLNRGAPAHAHRRDADQEAWRNAIITEVGTEKAIYDAGTLRAAVHHGELLADERRLVETLFRNRESGLNVLAATSTLAQGLNLPCEVVILAGTDRLDDTDPQEKKRSPLMPHEILNALGRAGRAGQAATGLSIVVPGAPVGVNLATMHMSSDKDLAVIFAEGDQCLPLADPLTTVFDQVEVDGASGDEAEYLLRRLAVSFGAAREGVETFESLTRRSFGFHQKATANSEAAEAWLASRKETLTAALQVVAPLPTLPWHEELAAKTGATSDFISSLSKAYDAAPKDSLDAFAWISWLLHQLDQSSDNFDSFLRPSTMAKVFGRAYTKQPGLEGQRKVALAGVLVSLDTWLSGAPLVDLEKVLVRFIAANEGKVNKPTQPDVKAKRARRFAIRLAPDIGFLCGILHQVALHIHAERGDAPRPMTGFLSQLIRRGFQTPYHFAIYRNGPYNSRPLVRAAYQRIEGSLDRQPTDDWNSVRQKVRQAEAILAFSDTSISNFDEQPLPTTTILRS